MQNCCVPICWQRRGGFCREIMRLGVKMFSAEISKNIVLVVGVLLLIGCDCGGRTKLSEISFTDVGISLPGQKFERASNGVDWHHTLEMSEGELVRLLTSSEAYRENIMTSSSDQTIQESLSEIIDMNDHLQFLDARREFSGHRWLLVVSGQKIDNVNKKWQVEFTLVR